MFATTLLEYTAAANFAIAGLLIGSLAGFGLCKLFGLDPDDIGRKVKKEIDTGFRVGGKAVTREVSTAEGGWGGMLVAIVRLVGGIAGVFLATISGCVS